MLKAVAIAAALVLAPAAALAAGCCGPDCGCCKDKAAAEAHQH